jgi:hypothetical protein
MGRWIQTSDEDRTRTTEEIGMLGENDAIANIAVKNLETARKFYEGVLGLTPVGAEGQEVVVFKSGNSRINVYRSQYAGTNQATALTWSVGQNLPGIARALKSKGVPFEHYDLPGMRLGTTSISSVTCRSRGSKIPTATFSASAIDRFR